MIERSNFILQARDLLRNKDFLNTTINQGWAVLAGPLSLVFIPLYLTTQLQGYYYAFISISALSILADLGFSNIILQFSAHEFAFLKYKEGRFSYDNPEAEIHLKKLAALFTFSVKWTLRILLLSFPIIFGIGFYLFSKNHDDIAWLIPWIIFSAGSALTFFNGVLLSFFEGCDMVARIQRIRFFYSFTFTAVVLTGLALHINLYALAFASFTGAIVTGVVLFIRYRKTIVQLRTISRQFSYKWRNEIVPLFRKYVISFSSSYLIFQIYTPLAFRFHGAEEAGRIGFSLAVWAAVTSLANIWIVSVVPKINILIAEKKWKDLDKLVFLRFLAGESTMIVVGIMFFVVFTLVSEYLPIANRFASLTNLGILFAVYVLQFLVSTLSVYMRGHKEDPFYMIYLVSAVFILLTTYFLTRNFSIEYIFTGLLSATLLFMPWYYSIFKKYRQQWHADTI